MTDLIYFSPQKGKKSKKAFRIISFSLYYSNRISFIYFADDVRTTVDIINLVTLIAMKRRTFLNLAGSAMLYSMLPPMRLLAKGLTRESVNGVPHVFFLPGEVEQIRKNALLPLLKPYLDYWSGLNPDDVRKTITKVTQTKELIRDFAHSLSAVQQQAVLYLVTGQPIHKEFVELRHKNGDGSSQMGLFPGSE